VLIEYIIGLGFSVRFSVKRSGALFISLLFLHTIVYGLLQSPSIDESKLNEEWRWVSFTTESGLPSNQISSLVESSNGVIWVATSTSVAWYDGFKWNPIDSTQGLPQRKVRSMSIGSDDSLVIVGEDGIIYHGGLRGFHRIELPIHPGEAVAFGRKIVAYHDNKLILIDSNRIEKYLPLPAGFTGLNEGRSLWITKGGSIWLNTQNGIYRWNGNSWDLKIRTNERDCIVNCLIENKNSNGLASIRMPFERRGVWEWSHKSSPRINRTTYGDWFKTMDINNRNDVIAVEKSGEIFIRRANRWSRLSMVPLSMKDITFVTFRQNGDLWVGTEKSLHLFKQYSLSWDYEKNRFPNRNRVHEIIQTIDGSIWLGTADGLEVHKQNREKQFITHILGKPLYEVTGLVEDTQGNIWISSGSAFDGAYRWDGANWTYWPIDTTLSYLRIHKIRKDRQGRLWFLGLSRNSSVQGPEEPGAYMYDGAAFKRWAIKDGLLSGRVYAFAEASNGSFWFGTHRALSRWTNGTWTHWRTKSDIPLVRIFTIAIDRDDKVWFADQSNGLCSIDSSGKLEQFTTKDGLVDNHIWDLAIDSRGALWITTEGGLSYYDRGKWKTYEAKSGLLSNDLWPVLPVGDSVYVGMRGKGLAILNLRRSHQPAPKIIFEPAVVEGNKAVIRVQPYAYWGELSPREILIRYSVNAGPWTAWSTTRDIILKDLHSGDYSFRIQAQNSFGEFEPKGVIGYFSIAPPLYLMPVFFLPLGSLFLVIAFIGIEYLVRMRRYNREMRESEAKFRRLAESTFEGIVIHDDGNIREANQNMTKMFGYSYNELKHKNMIQLIAPEARDFVRKQMASVFEKPIETIGLHKDGSKIWCEMIISSITTEGVTSSVAAIRDISDRKESEEKLLNYQEQLRSLASELSITEERERRQMASFLHDTIGQALAFCKIKLSALQTGNAPDAVKDSVKEVRNLVDQAILDTRSLTFDLSPPILYELGLEAAIETLIDQLRPQHELEFVFLDDKEPKSLDNEYRVLFYTAARELITNVIKHAKAQSVEVSICRVDNSIELNVIDDGAGFDMDKLSRAKSKQGGFGLFNIREKVRHIGGYIEVETAPGQGTRISVIAPLKITS
jgi:PAS domain S-box-containing protein